MNIMSATILRGSRAAKCMLDRRTQVFLFDNIQTRCKSKFTKFRTVRRDVYGQKPEPIGLLGYFLLSMPVGAFALGTWQVKRRKWKIDLIDSLKKRTSAEPIDLPLDLSELENKEYYQLRVKGQFLYEKEFLIGPRSLIIDGEALSEKGGGIMSGRPNTGYYVITPFKLEDRDVTIIVNRGWIPKKERTTFKQGNKIMGPVEIVGILRKTETRPPFVPANAPGKGVWHYRDLNAMAEMLETDPVYIELLAKYSLPHGPIGGQTRVNLRNEHLSYIFTWYALSACTGYMWYRYFLQKLPLL